MITVIQVLLENKLKETGLSAREAARQMGLSNSTVSATLKGAVVDLDTMIVTCKWMGVKPGDLLNAEAGGPSALSDTLAVVLQTNPSLAEAFERSVEKLKQGEIDAREITDMAAYIDYRLSLAERNKGRKAGGG